MIAIPLCILSLAAGVALLIKIKKESSGGLYKALAWLVILLSLLYMTCLVVRSAVHHRNAGHNGYEKEMYFHHPAMGMQCCPYMKGDSAMMKDSTMKGVMSCSAMPGSCCGNMVGSCCAQMANSCCAGMGMKEEQCMKGGKNGATMSCCKKDTTAKK